MTVDLSKHVNLPWLAKNTIFLCRHGSHAYNTNTPESDEDFKGVAIAPREVYLGFSKTWEQAESKEPDLVIYELRKFFRLASENNPNIFECLWVSSSDYILVAPLGEKLLANRDLFLSKKVKHTFSGFAASQLKRMKAHRRWLLSPVTHKPTREEYGLPERTLVPADQLMTAEAAIRKEMDSWELDLSGLDDAQRIALLEKIAKVISDLQISDDTKPRRAGRLLGFDENMIEVLDRERKYTTALREWQQYNEWKTKRNPKRAALEAKMGFDGKHAMHLCRLLKMCREILTTGKVIVKRPDAEELLAIRNGAWSYDQIVEWAEQQDKEMQELVKTSPLPKTPDLAKLDELCINLIEASL